MVSIAFYKVFLETAFTVVNEDKTSPISNILLMNYVLEDSFKNYVLTITLSPCHQWVASSFWVGLRE
ncbi:hypothetical protein T01_15014 [Trichinella spiralis]|uniref:Uncharacterized protein n=1 Tax=Trichinella spiralis TaxID=6334 RepID=A0A0V1AQU1_TRISP|nr:hypothetical protein T01_15014 [Trichinella spiralis]